MSDSAVLEPPKPIPQAKIGDKPFYFAHSENGASLAGLRSGQVRRQKAAKIEALERLISEVVPKVEQFVTAQMGHIHSQTPVLTVLEGHMARLDGLMSTTVNAAEFRDLAQARSKLFEQWAHLAGIPKPMAGREPRQSQRRVSLTPIDIDPPSVPSAPPAAPAQIPEVNRDVTP